MQSETVAPTLLRWQIIYSRPEMAPSLPRAVEIEVVEIVHGPSHPLQIILYHIVMTDQNKIDMLR